MLGNVILLYLLNEDILISMEVVVIMIFIFIFDLEGGDAFYIKVKLVAGAGFEPTTFGL